MLESIVAIAVGIVLIIIGILNRKGIISTLHSYHRKNVSEENRIPFGKMVGLGTIIVGVALALNGIFSLLAYQLTISVLAIVAAVVLYAGIAVGLGISFYAMYKYNRN